LHTKYQEYLRSIERLKREFLRSVLTCTNYILTQILKKPERLISPCNIRSENGEKEKKKKLIYITNI